MSSSKCFCVTCIPLSQETDKAVCYKAGNGNFTKEKPDRYHLIEWSKLTSPVLEQPTACASQKDTLRRAHHHLCNTPAKSAQPSSIREEPQDKPQRQTFCEVTGLCSFKMSRSRNTTKGWVPDWRRLKTWQQKYNTWSWFISILQRGKTTTIKERMGTTDKIWVFF